MLLFTFICGQLFLISTFFFNTTQKKQPTTTPYHDGALQDHQIPPFFNQTNHVSPTRLPLTECLCFAHTRASHPRSLTALVLFITTSQYSLFFISTISPITILINNLTSLYQYYFISHPLN